MNQSLPAEPLPLAEFELVRTRDPEEARQVVTGAFCPHRLRALDDIRLFRTRFHATTTSRVSLCYLDYGGEVHIAPEAQTTFYLVLIPLAGHAELRDCDDTAEYGSGAAAIPPVDRGYTIRVAAESTHLVLRIERNLLEGHLRAMLGHPLTQPIRFDLRMDTTAPDVRPWKRVLDLLRADIEDGCRSLAQPLVRGDMERLLLSQLLVGHPHNYSTLLQEPPVDAPPRVLREAAELIEAHASEDLFVEDIATSVGISTRALQQQFRRHWNTTPKAHLREIRLLRIRQELIAADPRKTKVTDVAARWGYRHPSHFAKDYRLRFGERPSATLNR